MRIEDSLIGEIEITNLRTQDQRLINMLRKASLSQNDNFDLNLKDEEGLSEKSLGSRIIFAVIKVFALIGAL